MPALASEAMYPGLSKAVQDRDEDVRRTAIETLAKLMQAVPTLASDQLRAVFLQAQGDSKQSVRQAAGKALKELDTLRTALAQGEAEIKEG